MVADGMAGKAEILQHQNMSLELNLESDGFSDRSTPIQTRFRKDKL